MEGFLQFSEDSFSEGDMKNLHLPSPENAFSPFTPNFIQHFGGTAPVEWDASLCFRVSRGTFFYVFYSLSRGEMENKKVTQKLFALIMEHYEVATLRVDIEAAKLDGGDLNEKIRANLLRSYVGKISTRFGYIASAELLSREAGYIRPGGFVSFETKAMLGIIKPVVGMDLVAKVIDLNTDMFILARYRCVDVMIFRLSTTTEEGLNLFNRVKLGDHVRVSILRYEINTERAERGWGGRYQAVGKIIDVVEEHERFMLPRIMVERDLVYEKPEKWDVPTTSDMDEIIMRRQWELLSSIVDPAALIYNKKYAGERGDVVARARGADIHYYQTWEIVKKFGIDAGKVRAGELGAPGVGHALADLGFSKAEGREKAHLIVTTDEHIKLGQLEIGGYALVLMKEGVNEPAMRWLAANFRTCHVYKPFTSPPTSGEIWVVCSELATELEGREGGAAVGEGEEPWNTVAITNEEQQAEWDAAISVIKEWYINKINEARHNVLSMATTRSYLNADRRREIKEKQIETAQEWCKKMGIEYVARPRIDVLKV